ncbi:hypothetical protein NQD34_000559 [Periophthalmus magnuspinnatus]|nr:hypothetical protein NQD34_000559 [Periophthalmus magnuspinnatus]
MSCTEAIMLVNGGNRCAGWVQVKYGGMWHHLCHDDFTLIHGFIGCRDMGCGFPQNLPPSNIRQSVKDTLNISCSGHEQRLTDCRISSTPAESSSAECKPAFLMCDIYPSAPEMSMFSTLADVAPQALTGYRGHRVLVTCSVTSPHRVSSFNLKFYSHGLLMSLENKTAVDNTAHFMLGEQIQEGKYQCSYDYELSPGIFSEHGGFTLKIKG